MKSALLLLVGAAVLLAGCATQAPTRSGNAALMQLFNQADKDGDGKISRREFTDFMIAEAFVLYDTDKTGRVTLDQWVAGGGTPQSFRAMGGSPTRPLTLPEVQNSKVARDQMALPFDGADKSRSGYLTLEEFIAFRTAAAPYVR